MATGWQVSSAGGGRFDLALIFVLLGEPAKVDEGRRKAGDRGDVLPLGPCKEPNDFRLRNVGVVGRSSEPELGALRRGVFLE